MVLYSGVFSRFLAHHAEHLPYPLFVFTGIVLWAFCSTSISTAASGMLNHQRLIASIYFPREIIPLSFVTAALVDLAVALVILLLMMAYYGFPVLWGALLGLPVVAVFAVLVSAVCLFISSIQVRIRDISVALPMLLQVLMFTTPIVYPASVIPAGVQNLYWLNPFAILIDSFREAVVLGSVPSANDMLYCALVALVCFLISYVVFKKIEATIVDQI
jgi:lipopolysaccharide transport system permease protein